ncbi:MAG: prolyl aminopeptidase [Alphaproteobacteria bacterium]|nr:prolyl aminopeptidase [Alphaproteobacteria bacterium]
MVRRELFPEITPYETGVLPLDGEHVMYWEQSGNPTGAPVLFLHGGPGAGTTPTHRRFFDPVRYRIVLFDQRGAGKSTPSASIEDNTTQHLISDIERLREALAIEQWLIFGGSWGSTLGLAYAQAHSERCRGLIMRGIFLCGDEEVDWFMRGMGRFFPEAWRKFAEAVPEAERDELLTAYRRRLDSADPDVSVPAARAWASYEATCSTLRPNGHAVVAMSDPASALALARLEAHYLAHRAFLQDGALLANIDAIRHLPAVIVQGRYDMVCPPTTADRLATAWPEARFEIIADAGHSALEPGIRAALLKATEMMKQTS